ncbi:hypothetical protein GCM10023178_16660 [Actinomadura luteofluorescens]
MNQGASTPRRELLRGRPGRDRQIPQPPVAFGVAAVHAGFRVRYHTAADLLETLYPRLGKRGGRLGQA